MHFVENLFKKKEKEKKVSIQIYKIKSLPFSTNYFNAFLSMTVHTARINSTEINFL